MELHITPLSIEESKRIGVVNTQFDTTFPTKMKQITGSCWTPEQNCWHIPYTREAWAKFQKIFEGHTIIRELNKEEKATVERETVKVAFDSTVAFDKIIARRCAEQPDRIFLSIPQDRIDWKTYVNQIEKSTYHATDKLWSVPRTKELYQQFAEYFGDTLVVDKKTAVVLTQQKPVYVLPQYPRFDDKLTVFNHPTKQDIWCLHLPKILVPIHLETVKNIQGRQWHPDRKCWTLPHSPFTIDTLKAHFGDALDIDLSDAPNPSPKTTETLRQTAGFSESLNTPFNPTSNLTFPKSQKRVPQKPMQTPPQYQDEITKLVEKMTLKRMSIETIKLYKNCVAHFFKHYDNQHPQDITKEQIIQYMLQRIQNEGMSETQQNNFINAIKCYYEFVLGRERTYYDLQRPKRPFQLPNVLSETEAIKLFDSVQNIKHKCILLAIYSGGIRLSEVVNLRVEDLREADNYMFIKGGKGKKDRLTLLSPKLLTYLKPYFEEYKPKYWLFEGQMGGQYSKRSVQCILRDAVAKSGVNPFATVHTLRHSFATHLVLAGENLITIRDLLGHEDLKTTEIYIHLTGEFIRNTKSPLDRLKF